MGQSISVEKPGRETERYQRKLAVECMAPDSAGAFAAQWRDLLTRCLEANAFLEPAFALAAARYLGNSRRLRFLFVWEVSNAGTRGALLGLCAVQLPGDFQPASFLRLWTHKQSTLVIPLLVRARAGEALDAILAWRKKAHPDIVGATFPLLPLEGETFELLKTHVAAQGLCICILDHHRRAALYHKDNPDLFLAQSISPKRRKELRRLRRRLETKGEVTVRVSRGRSDIQIASDHFLELEANGWKGKRGTALAVAPRRAAFAREMIADLSSEEKCRIISMDVNGAPIAIGVILISGDWAFFWKTAYDEEFAEFSPGVQLTLELSRVLLADKKINVTDSCACADHPMIDHIWSERMTVGDVFISLDADRSKSFAFAVACEYFRRYVRSVLKRGLSGMRRLL